MSALILLDGAADPHQTPVPPPQRAEPHQAAPASRLGFALDAVLGAYSQVLFARSRFVGLALLAASFIVPRIGLAGLIGVALATLIALLLQLDREAIRQGTLGYNALLVFLGLGKWTMGAVASRQTKIPDTI